MTTKLAIRKGSEAITGPIMAWADSTTDATTTRRRDLLRDKSRSLADFFQFAGKEPEQVQPGDVKAWQLDLEQRGLAPATVYAKVCRVSSFYKWALKDSAMAERLQRNPVDLARPKPPKAYQSEAAKALSDDDLAALLAVVKAKAQSGDLVGLRDYAILLHLALTGRRRAEVIGLRWGDIKTNGVMVVSYRVKGGEIETRLVRDPSVKEAMIAYLEASGRLASMTEGSPIWTRHDRAGNPGQPLTSHAFASNLKRYARLAGLQGIHVHQLRHTFARMAGDASGSLAEVQESLGHKNAATTRIYLRRVGVRRDLFSQRIAERLGI